MRKRVHIALGVLLVALAGVIAWQVLRQREPVYQGKRLSVWLERRNVEGNADGPAVQAIRHIGTNALPVLIEMLHAKDARLKVLIMTWANKQNLVHFHFKPAHQRRHEAVFGYEALGPLASAQVPSLIDTLTNAPSPGVRQAAASAMGCIGAEARVAAPALFRAAKDTNDGVRASAFAALARILPDPQITIPVLVAGLDDRFAVAQWNAANALGRYGEQARAAVPALLRRVATNRAAGLEYDAAASALKAIDPEAAAKAGVK